MKTYSRTGTAPIVMSNFSAAIERAPLLLHAFGKIFRGHRADDPLAIDADRLPSRTTGDNLR
ncbi:hypothetical protein BURKHO8Y_110003 [Burkholderia sp. 8Y]|nr:hypothetical protein BURKHO8Y_110003 [Burkholderia sp. 8Y]